MIETNDVLEKAKREFFKTKFNLQLNEWMKKNKDKGGTQEAFALMIGVSKNMIGQYKQGIIPRPETLKRIISVLGVPDDYFTPTTEAELYRFSPEFMTDIGETQIRPYCEEVGLDPQFLVVMNNTFGDSLGEKFPFWTPITLNPDIRQIFDNTYIRPDPVTFWSDSAEMDSDVKMFQVEVVKRGGSEEKKKRLTLTDPDILFLRDVQNEVRDYVDFLFWKRKKELTEEADEVSRRAKILDDEGEVKKILVHMARDKNEIDKYYKGYVDKEPEQATEGRGENADD